MEKNLVTILKNTEKRRGPFWGDFYSPPPTIGGSIYWCSYTECVVTGKHRINPENSIFQRKKTTRSEFFVFLYIIKVQTYWSSEVSSFTRGGNKHIPRALLCKKFNSEQPLSEAFFDVIRIFGSIEPKSESNFPFLYISNISSEPLAPFLGEIDICACAIFVRNSILNNHHLKLFWFNAYFWQCWAPK